MHTRIRNVTPRPWREVGKRGQILLVFGFLWVGTGVGTLISPRPEAWDDVPLLREFPGGWAWVACGAFAMFYAMRPRRVVHDGVAFVALYLPPAFRAGAYMLAWADSLTPFGAIGYPRGWLSALVYLGLVAAVMICSSWPEPPDHSHKACHE